jgi:glycosyltransferase involved in cell wall biosynthesis
LLSKYFSHRPVILDIDDWDSAATKGRGVHPIRYDLHRILYPNSYFHTAALEEFTRLADSITVSSAFLANKFGGTIVPHARDTDFLDPADFNRSELRERWEIGHTKLIMFLGTVRPHKGVEDLIQAVRLLKRDDVALWLVGADMASPYVNKLMTQGQDAVKVLGYQPFTEIPKFLSIADLVVIPQRKTPFAMAQVPAKIFDAMAMAKPIIGTDVSDIPQILDGCGWVVLSGNVEALAKSISYVLDNGAMAEEMGQKARLKCQRLYSWTAAREILHQVMRKYE